MAYDPYAKFHKKKAFTNSQNSSDKSTEKSETKGKNVLNIESESLKNILEFALKKSFNPETQTRNLRVGSNSVNTRSPLQMFLDTFRGKCAEYAFLQELKKSDEENALTDELRNQQVDLNISSQNCDNGDFEFGPVHLSIKSTKTIGSLLLLELKNYNETGQETNITSPKKVDFFILFGIAFHEKDVKNILKNAETYQEAKSKMPGVYDLMNKEKITFNVIGFLNQEGFQEVIKNNQLAKEGEIEIGTPLEVDNYIIPREQSNKHFNDAMGCRIKDKDNSRTSQTPVTLLTNPDVGMKELMSVIKTKIESSQESVTTLVQRKNKI